VNRCHGGNDGAVFAAQLATHYPRNVGSGESVSTPTAAGDIRTA
jgi:hypothetical protein